jgi:PAS domain S-box-containing protein
MNMPGEWMENFSGAITICDREGIILEMNNKACDTFAKYGGRELIGKNLFDCHPEPARTKLKTMMAEQRTNIYTIEKNGVKKLIHQSPWFKNGEYAGFVELSLEIPFDMPHFMRK